MHANLIVPAKTEGAQAGFIVMEPTDYPPMSGSNSMCVVTVLLETGMVRMHEPETRLLLDTPGGPVEAVATCRGGRCERVRVRNVPSFATHLDAATEVAGLGTVSADIAYGGAFFAIVDAHALGFRLSRDEARDLVEVGERIKRCVAEQHPVAHPENPDINTVTFTQFAGPVERHGEDLVSRNAVVVSPGKIDRSPCGTGTSARLAALHARGAAAPGQRLLNRSIIDSEFEASIEDIVDVGGRRLDAVGPGVDHRPAPVHARSLGPVPRGLRAFRHLVHAVATAQGSRRPPCETRRRGGILRCAGGARSF